MTAYLLALVLGADLYVQPGAAGGTGSQADPFGTVQQGVDAAASGDTVHLLPGTYFENVQVAKNGVTLRSDPPGAATIDGRNQGIALKIDGVGWVIDGLRIENGLHFNLLVLGSASDPCPSARPSGGVESARVQTGGLSKPPSGGCNAGPPDSNSYDVSLKCMAGRVYVHDSQFLAEACTANLELAYLDTGPITVEGNELSGSHWNLLNLNDVHGAEVSRNRLHGPCCDGQVLGTQQNAAGLYVDNGSTDVFAHHNLMLDTGRAGIEGFDELNAHSNEGFVVRNNTIIGPGQAGIIFNAVSGTARSNLVSGVRCSGGCDACPQPSGFVIENSEGTGTGPPSASVGFDLFQGLGATPYCLQNSATVNHAGPASFASPLFVGADAGDYRLLAHSPAIDHGDPSSPAGVDLLGQPFPQPGPDAGAPRADIGAFEYQPDSPSDAGFDAGVDAGPVAVIAPASQSVAAGDTVTLDASGSKPGAGATLAQLRWTQPQGPTAVALADAGQVSFTAREPGDYLFRLVVEDSSGATSAPATASVHVSGEPYRPPSKLGCGCQASAAPALVFLLVLWPGPRRRRRRLHG